MSVNTTAYYLDDVVGGSDQSGFLSVPTRSMEQDDGGSGPLSSLLNEHTFLSPFSPLLRRPGSKMMSDPNITISLQQCSHVSVVVQVHEPAKISSSDQLPQLCLFPLVGDANSSSLGKTLADEADKNSHVVLCVNPDAFGKSLPAQVTMETARLVAQVANIESEDWVRKYRYDEVLWSNRKEVVVNNGLLRVSTGIAQDALHGRGGGTLLTMGDKKMTTLFGMKAVSRMQAFTPTNLAVADLGMMGMVYSQVLDGLTTDAVMTLSVLEVVDEDSIRDLLEAHRPGTTSTTTLRLRHISRFPTVEGLSTEPVDSLGGLFHLVKRALGKKPRGHVLCFLSIWENTVDQSLANSAKRTLLTFGSLSSGHIPPAATALEKRRMAFMRKSLNGLRGVLRGSMTTTTSSWRETILNELLHESLFSGKAVVVASVAAESEAYERSHHTLDYVHRVKLTSTAQSPYLATASSGRKARTDASISSTSSPEELVKSFGGESTLLRSITTDPRQRLAKLMKTTPTKPRRLYVSSKDDDSDEDYKPTNYMAVDPGNISFFDPPSESFLEFDKQNPNSPFRTIDDYDEDEKEKPSPSRSVQLESTDLFQDAWMAGQDDYEDMPDQAPMVEDYPEPVSPYLKADKTVPEDVPPEEPLEETFFTPMTEPFQDPTPTRQLWDETPSAEDVDQAPQLPIVPEREELGPKEPSLDEDLVKEWLEDEYLEQQPSPSLETPPEPYPSLARTPKRFDPPETQTRSWKQRRVLEDPEGMPLEATPPPSARAPSSPRDPSKRPIVHNPEDRENRREPFSARTTPTQDETPEPTPRPQRTRPRSQVHSPLRPQPDHPTVTTKSKEEFRREIHSIQEAVEEIRRANSGMWVSSSASLERLQAFQNSQLMIMDEAVAGRKRAEEELAALKQKLRQQAEDHGSVRHQYQEQIADLEKQVEDAANGRMDVEKIAEDAIAGQDRAEARLGATEKALGDSRAALEKKEDELDAARKSTQQALRDLQDSQAKHANLAIDKRDRARHVAELEEKVQDLSEERDRLEAALNGSGQDVGEAKSKLAGVAVQLRASKAESLKWKQRSDDLATQLKKLRESSSKDKDAAMSLAKMETTNLEQELVACRRRIVELETSKSSLETTAEIEKKSLKERFEAEKERADRLQGEVETFQISSEMQEGHLNQLLQARLDEAKRLRRDLDRARTERDAAKKHMTSLKAGIEKFQRETKDQVTSFIQEKKAAESRLRELEEECNQRISGLEREVEDLSDSLREAEEQKAQYEQRIQELERQLSAMSLTKREADQLREKYEAVASEASGARKDLSEKDVAIQQLRLDLEMSKRQLEQQKEASRSIATSHRETEQLKNEYKGRVEDLERQVSRSSANERDNERLKERYEGAAKEASANRAKLEEKDLENQQLRMDLELSKRQLEHQQQTSKSISTSHREAEQLKNEYKERVEDLELQVSRLSANEREAARLKERCDNAAKEVGAARAELEQKELEIQKLQMDLEMSKGQLEQQQQTSRSISASHRETEQLKNEYEERVEQLERELSSLSSVNERDTERLKERYEGATKEASLARTELEQRDSEMQQLQLDLELSKRQLAQQQQTSRSISSSHREAEQLKNEYKERVEQLERQLSMLSSVNERDSERLKERYESATKEASLARTELKQKEVEMQQLHMDVDLLKRQLDQQQQATRSISSSHREVEQLKNDYKDQVEQLERQLSKLSANERDAEVLKERYEGKAHEASLARTTLEQRDVEVQQLKLDLELLKREFDQQEHNSRSLATSHRETEQLKNKYKERVEQLERQLSRLSVNERNAERLKERYESAAKDASSTRAVLERKESEIQQLLLELELLKRQIDQQEEASKTMSESYLEAEQLNQQYKNRVERLERQITSLLRSDRKVERLQERYESAAREVSSTRSELDKRDLEMQQLRMELDLLKQQLDQQDQANRSMSTSQRELTTLKDEYKERVEQLQRQLSRASIAERETDRLKERYETASLEARSARKELGEKEAEIQTLRLDLDLSKRQLEQQEQASRASQSVFEDERMALNRHKIRHLERENEVLRSELRVSSDGVATSAELRMEQSRRLEAEDLIAIMAQRAKQSLEERDEEVRSLKQMLCIQMEEKEAENRILRDRLLDRDRAAIDGEESGNRRARLSSSTYPTDRRTRGESQA